MNEENKLLWKIVKEIEKVCKEQLLLRLSTCVEMDSIISGAERILALIPPRMSEEEIEKAIFDHTGSYISKAIREELAHALSGKITKPFNPNLRCEDCIHCFKKGGCNCKNYEKFEPKPECNHNWFLLVSGLNYQTYLCTKCKDYKSEPIKPQQFCECKEPHVTRKCKDAQCQVCHRCSKPIKPQPKLEIEELDRSKFCIPYVDDARLTQVGLMVIVDTINSIIRTINEMRRGE